MKKAVILLIFQMLVFNLLSGQSIIEYSGGLRTNFQIFSDTTNLNVTDQIIILKPEIEKNIYADGYMGYSYQSLHLEFTSGKRIRSVEDYSVKKDEYKLTLIDNENIILATIKIPVESVRAIENPFRPNIYYDKIFYSIDLINIPVLALEKTSIINIVKLK